ncbi:MAG TPA: hypothetical protein VJ123_07630 [Anaerolineales bacterium]|nr:hypothetical protein [Anaerolineales bacterium]
MAGFAVRPSALALAKGPAAQFTFEPHITPLIINPTPPPFAPGELSSDGSFEGFRFLSLDELAPGLVWGGTVLFLALGGGSLLALGRWYWRAKIRPLETSKCQVEVAIVGVLVAVAGLFVLALGIALIAGSAAEGPFGIHGAAVGLMMAIVGGLFIVFGVNMVRASGCLPGQGSLGN